MTINAGLMMMTGLCPRYSHKHHLHRQHNNSNSSNNSHHLSNNHNLPLKPPQKQKGEVVDRVSFLASLHHSPQAMSLPHRSQLPQQHQRQRLNHPRA
jgi:hypothetical protein